MGTDTHVPPDTTPRATWPPRFWTHGPELGIAWATELLSATGCAATGAQAGCRASTLETSNAAKRFMRGPLSPASDGSAS